MSALPPVPTPLRFHSVTDNVLTPGPGTARLVLMPPDLWKEVEAYLRSKGFQPY